jgi:hypothetical protein
VNELKEYIKLYQQITKQAGLHAAARREEFQRNWLEFQT